MRKCIATALLVLIFANHSLVLMPSARAGTGVGVAVSVDMYSLDRIAGELAQGEKEEPEPQPSEPPDISC